MKTFCWNVALSFYFLSLRVGTTANSEEVPYLKLQSLNSLNPLGLRSSRKTLVKDWQSKEVNPNLILV